MVCFCASSQRAQIIQDMEYRFSGAGNAQRYGFAMALATARRDTELLLN